MNVFHCSTEVAAEAISEPGKVTQIQIKWS